jgi:hypothetical protein
MKEHGVTLYVKSTKTFTHTEVVNVRGPISGGPRVRYSPVYNAKAVAMYEYIVPNDQKKILEIVEDVAHRLGVEVRVLDVTREHLLEREVQEHVGRISTFPTLTDDLGRRIEGKIPRVQIVSFFSHLKTEIDFFSDRHMS